MPILSCVWTSIYKDGSLVCLKWFMDAGVRAGKKPSCGSKNSRVSGWSPAIWVFAKQSRLALKLYFCLWVPYHGAKDASSKVAFLAEHIHQTGSHTNSIKSFIMVELYACAVQSLGLTFVSTGGIHLHI